MAPKSPCLHCPDRKPGCHNETCTHGWMEYQAEVEKLRDERAKLAKTWNASTAKETAYRRYLNRLKKHPKRRSK